MNTDCLHTDVSDFLALSEQSGSYHQIYCVIRLDELMAFCLSLYLSLSRSVLG